MMIPTFGNINVGAVVRHHSSVNESTRQFLKNCCCSCFSFCNKNEQQDAKRNAELWAKWTWKTFEETIKLGQNRSIEA